MPLNDKRTVILAAFVAAFCACGESGPPAHTGGESASGGVAGAPASRRGVVPIAFEAKKQGSKPFPFALVEGKIGNQPARFILDTGAAVHAIDASAAAAAGVASPANGTVMSIDGWGALPNHAVAIRELSASIRSHGIAGIIAPQLLAEGGEAVVVDLLNHQMRMAPKSTAWSAMDDIGVLLTPPAQRKLCPADAEGVAGLALAVDAVVDGEATHLAIDSGASRSILLEGSKGAVRATAHPVLGRSVAAGASVDVATSIYGGVPITAGAWSGTVDVGVTTPHRAAHCGAEGRLGMDVLRDCALALTADEFLVACRATAK